MAPLTELPRHSRRMSFCLKPPQSLRGLNDLSSDSNTSDTPLILSRPALPYHKGLGPEDCRNVPATKTHDQKARCMAWNSMKRYAQPTKPTSVGRRCKASWSFCPILGWTTTSTNKETPRWWSICIWTFLTEDSQTSGDEQQQLEQRGHMTNEPTRGLDWLAQKADQAIAPAPVPLPCVYTWKDVPEPRMQVLSKGSCPSLPGKCQLA